MTSKILYLVKHVYIHSRGESQYVVNDVRSTLKIYDCQHKQLIN
jgi:hypothetical protein